ncbi:GTP-binding protein [Parasalinivibrio latis]|uniref:CobW family GTP-binding protein n=1 Tax=Parasalinivibrio latis TaxID=2952610 RepID=UPI0030DEA575
MGQIPCNIITGFLGAGKTTAILSLLKYKPENEKWAVLVNEFGEVGVDGAFLQEQGAVVKEVPGGCMCCVAGLPMAIGINALLAQKPDRLIVEPTGLGHPKDIIRKLESEHYSDYIAVNATITLVDPRNLSDEKYTSNSNFQDQIALADVLVANKIDACTDEDLRCFDEFSASLKPEKSLTGKVELGNLLPEWLDLPKVSREGTHSHHHHHDDDPMPAFELEPGEQFCRKENKGQGYHSCGWFFAADAVFPFDSLYGLFANLNAERVKAVVNTDQGSFAFNVVNQMVTVNSLSLDGVESRIEVIDESPLPWDELESILLSFIKNN